MQQNTNTQLTVVQQKYQVLSAAKGFDSFVKLFELAGNEPEQAKNLAEKEAYHLAQLMADSLDLSGMPPAALMMEMRKIPLQGVSLDPTLGLAYLIIQDKAKGKVELQITGRGKAVQGIAQNIIKGVDAAVIYEGDTTAIVKDLITIIPAFKANAKVSGGILTITWGDGRVSQEFYRESHIAGWHRRSAKRFGGTGNMNYTSFNSGIEPGFLCSKMLKHKLSRIGISPFPNAYKRLSPEQIKNLPEDAGEQVYTDEPDYADVVSDNGQYNDGAHNEPPVQQSETTTSELEL